MTVPAPDMANLPLIDERTANAAPQGRPTPSPKWQTGAPLQTTGGRNATGADKIGKTTCSRSQSRRTTTWWSVSHRLISPGPAT